VGLKAPSSKLQPPEKSEIRNSKREGNLKKQGIAHPKAFFLVPPDFWKPGWWFRSFDA
jgi:hypothetical protein